MVRTFALILAAAGVMVLWSGGTSYAGKDGDTKKKDFGVNTGPVPEECVKFEDGEIGKEGITKIVDNVPITLYDWVMKEGETGEYIGFSFTVEGTDVTFSVKCGQDIFEGTESPWVNPNGLSGNTVKAISNIVFCLEDDGGGVSSPGQFGM